MTDLKRSLRLVDGLAMVVGIMVGSGIFRTPGLVAAQLGRPWLTFVAWIAGGALALLGALCCAELATRHPAAGGKYVYVREAFGPRAGFVVGWVEGLAIYPAAIAGIAVVAGEYTGRLAGLDAGHTRWVGAGLAALFTAINLAGVASGRWVQNLVTGAKVLALTGVVVLAFAFGSGAGWPSTLPTAPAGRRAGGARGAGVVEREHLRDAARAVRAGARGAGPARAGTRQRRWHAMGRDAARGRGGDRARRHGLVRVPAGPRHHGDSRDRQFHGAVAVPAARAPARRAVSGAGVSLGAARVRRGLRGAVRGDGARPAGACGGSAGVAGGGICAELDGEAGEAVIPPTPARAP